METIAKGKRDVLAYLESTGADVYGLVRDDTGNLVLLAGGRVFSGEGTLCINGKILIVAGGVIQNVPDGTYTLPDFEKT